MKKDDKILLAEALDYLQHTQPVFLATCEGDQPRLRPVTLIWFKKKLWVATGAKNAKMRQILKNDKIELCLFAEQQKSQGYVRACGKAVVVTNKRTRRSLAASLPFFKDLWSDREDRRYALLEIRVKAIDYLKPNQLKVKKFRL
jgi:uncharacterized pyridoxamine 5'-phosphate oxidase family protein